MENALFHLVNRRDERVDHELGKSDQLTLFRNVRWEKYESIFCSKKFNTDKNKKNPENLFLLSMFKALEGILKYQK